MTNNELKIYASLKHKKFRKEHGLFMVEGYKTIEELLKSDLKLIKVLGASNALDRISDKWTNLKEQVSSKTMQRISNMKSASDIIAIVQLPILENYDCLGKTILIDDIQDPGNLGTIIRTAHWFGFNQIICSEKSVDLFNYKVIQASMGTVFKLKVSYANLENVISNFRKNNLRVLGTFMNGESIYNFKFTEQDVFVLGNEGKGISREVEGLLDQKITIPNFSKGDLTESLNISIAGAVVCSEMSKRLL